MGSARAGSNPAADVFYSVDKTQMAGDRSGYRAKRLYVLSAIVSFRYFLADIEILSPSYVNSDVRRLLSVAIARVRECYTSDAL